MNDISDELRRRRWTWIGHTLRMDHTADCVTALRWTQEGKRPRGKPKVTWRRTVEVERDRAGWRTWNEAKIVARDREVWKDSV